MNTAPMSIELMNMMLRMYNDPGDSETGEEAQYKAKNSNEIDADSVQFRNDINYTLDPANLSASIYKPASGSNTDVGGTDGAKIFAGQERETDDDYVFERGFYSIYDPFYPEYSLLLPHTMGDNNRTLINRLWIRLYTAIGGLGKEIQHGNLTGAAVDAADDNEAIFLSKLIADNYPGGIAFLDVAKVNNFSATTVPALISEIQDAIVFCDFDRHNHLFK